MDHRQRFSHVSFTGEGEEGEEDFIGISRGIRRGRGLVTSNPDD